MRIVLVEWEDIMGMTHKPLPVCDSEIRPLVKHTIGYLLEFGKHLVVVTDYDETHDGGGGYGHNDFTVIPKGVVLNVVDLVKQGEPDPGPDVIVNPIVENDDDTVMRG